MSTSYSLDRQSPGLRDFQPKFGAFVRQFSFSYFVKAKFGAFVRIFI
jgi:hypothetical protein